MLIYLFCKCYSCDGISPTDCTFITVHSVNDFMVTWYANEETKLARSSLIFRPDVDV